MMELRDIQHFAQLVQEVAAVTSDLGVEAGLHNFRMTSLLGVCLPCIMPTC